MNIEPHILREALETANLQGRIDALDITRDDPRLPDQVKAAAKYADAEIKTFTKAKNLLT